ncbi:MAG: formate dehydrogenase subunit alpha [Candidatus Ranarchaeia archaeon]
MYDYVKTTCVYCGVGCSITLIVDKKKQRIVGASPYPNSVTDKGKLCIKGWNVYEYVQNKERLTSPLVRKKDKFEKVSWDEALDLIANKLTEIKNKNGPDNISIFGSAKATNEDNYIIQKWTRACIGTNNIDHCARLCHASTVTGLSKTFGSGAMTNSIDEFKHSEVVLITGSNTTHQHPILGANIVRAIKQDGTKLIVVDPRTIPIANFATIHLKQNPGTDVAWINGIINIIIENQLHDKQFIDTRTEGFEDIIRTVSQYTPEYVEEITGIPKGELVKAAFLFGNAKTASIIYSMGITQHISGTDNVVSLANLAMLTGNIGKPGTGVNPLRGQQNVQGACDVGGLPDVYPGYQKVNDPEKKEKFSKIWKATLSEKPGLTVVESFHEAVKGNVKAMFFMGENPVITDPNQNEVIKGLKNLELLVVQDIFLTETAKLADVVLPAASFAERTGTFTNTERRVQLINPAIDKIGDSREDWEIICEISNRMGYPMSYTGPKEIMDEIASVSPIYGGINYERIKDVGLQWPCLDNEHPGSPILHVSSFARGKGKFFPIDFRKPAEETDEEYPLILTTGRIYQHYHSRTMTKRTAVLEREEPEAFVEIHPEDAADLGIKKNDYVKVTSRRGSITVLVRITENIKRNTVFVPFHYPEAPVNRLTNDALDPESKIPELKVCAVKIEKLEGK